MTAVNPSSTRARERAGVERAAPDNFPCELERELLRRGVVAADERVLVGTALGELARGERVEACDHRCTEERLRPLGKRDGLLRAEVAGDAENRSGADCVCERGGRVVSAVG